MPVAPAPQNLSQPSMSPDVATCPLGGITPFADPCFRVCFVNLSQAAGGRWPRGSKGKSPGTLQKRLELGVWQAGEAELCWWGNLSTLCLA